METTLPKSSPVRVGDAVMFFDPYGEWHSALVTEAHNAGHEEQYPNASINLVYVSDKADERDQYGRQIKRYTSVVHKSNQSAHGMYWIRLIELT